jgi:Condensation domain/Phosphopantetheine attachment site
MPAPVPLAHQQKWLWNLIQRHGDWNNVVVYTFRIKGALDVPVLQRSLEEVTRRHSALRTEFRTIDGVAHQLIAEPRSNPLQCVSIGDGSTSGTAADAQRFVEECFDLRLDLSDGPPFRIHLLKLDENEHWLVLSVHRLIADCASVEHAFREMWTLYAQALQGRLPVLSKDPLTYADYVAWQLKTARDWQSKHGAHWEKRMHDAKPWQAPIENCAVPAVRSRMGNMRCQFGSGLTASLREQARRSRTLLANLVLTIYAAALWRWSKQRDFIVPVVVAGRQSEQKSIVGIFSHVLYLRMQLMGHETFSQLLSYVGNEFFRALSHQDAGRMAAQAPELTGTVFQWITWHPEEDFKVVLPETWDSLELMVERVAIRDFGEGFSVMPPRTADVEVNFLDTAEGIMASGMYREDRFTAQEMQRFLAEVRYAAEQFVKDPNARVLYQAPQGEIEEQLARIWSGVLKVAPVGRDDNFFELGGQSDAAMDVLTQTGECLSVELPFFALFQSPTIRQMAQHIERLQTGGSEQLLDSVDAI